MERTTADIKVFGICLDLKCMSEAHARLKCLAFGLFPSRK